MNINSKVNIDKIKELARSKGIKNKHLCDAFGLGRGYLNDVKAGKTVMDAERVATIAGMLNTTVEYLMDETDDPEIPSNPNIIDLSSLSEAKKNVILLILNSDDEFLKSQMSLWKSEKSTDVNK